MTRPILETDRLQLVELAPDDADEMMDVLDDERLHTFIGGGPASLEELRARYRRLAVGRSADGREMWQNWIVRLRLDGRAIGTMQANIVDGGRAASIAWIVGVRWQGQGYATEAARAVVAWLDASGVTTITANVHPDHHASAAVARVAGLSPTDAFEDGERVWRRMHPSRNRGSGSLARSSR